MNKFKTDRLEKAVNIAKSKGYKVYAFQTGLISQVFIENKEGQICTIQSDLFRDSVNTVHKPNLKSGNGYQMSKHIGDIEKGFTMCPNWGDYRTVKKYKNFADYQNSVTVLDYWEI